MNLDSEFRALMPKLTKSEYSKLEQSIITEGCRDALITWNETLIDGYNRYEICQKQSIIFKTTSMSFENREDVANWIIDNQLSRRNLTVEQKNYLIGKKYKREKQAHGGDRKSSGNFYHLKTEEKVAQEQKVSPKSVRNAEKFADAVDVIAENVGEYVKDEILSRDIKATAKEVQKLAQQSPDLQKRAIAKVQRSEADSIEAATRQILNEQKEAKAKAKLQTNDKAEAQVVLGDSVQLLNKIPDRSYDCLFTDPFYITDVENFEAFTRSWIHKAFAKIKNSGRAFVFCSSNPIEISIYQKELSNVPNFTLGNLLVWTIGQSTCLDIQEYDRPNTNIYF
jgi:hypothetical protein